MAYVRVWPVVVGCMLIAVGLMALLGGALASGSGAGTTGEEALMDALLGAPGILLGGGIALLLWGLTEKSARGD